MKIYNVTGYSLIGMQDHLQFLVRNNTKSQRQIEF